MLFRKAINNPSRVCLAHGVSGSDVLQLKGISQPESVAHWEAGGD